MSLFLYEAPPRSPFLFCAKLFFGSLLILLCPGCFLFLALSTLLNWNVFTDWLVASSLAASSLPLFHFFFLGVSTSHTSQSVTLTHFAMSFYEQAFCLPIFFPNFMFGETRSKLSSSSWRAFASTHPLCFLLLFLGRFFLLALPLLFGTLLPSLRRPPFPPHAPALIISF